MGPKLLMRKPIQRWSSQGLSQNGYGYIYMYTCTWPYTCSIGLPCKGDPLDFLALRTCFAKGFHLFFMDVQLCCSTPLRTSLGFRKFAPFLQGGPLKVSLDRVRFAPICKGGPLASHWMLLGLQPLAMGTHPLESYLILVSLHIFCKGGPSGFHWILLNSHLFC